MATYTVKKGDNLTHIAKRLGIGSWRKLYYHPKNSDFRRKRPNPNLIFPGDELYVPDGQSGPKVINLDETRIVIRPELKEKDVTKLSDDEVEEVFGDILEELPADWKADFETYIGTPAGVGTTVISLVSLFASVGAWAMASPAVVAVRLGVGWVSAWETNTKMYGYRSWAYTITAWTFDKMMPSSSPEMMRRFEAFSSADIVRERKDVWTESQNRTLRELKQQLQKPGVSKDVIQTEFKLVGHRNKAAHGGIEKKLCHALLKDCESNFRGTNLASWRDGYSVLYPR